MARPDDPDDRPRRGAPKRGGGKRAGKKRPAGRGRPSSTSRGASSGRGIGKPAAGKRPGARRARPESPAAGKRGAGKRGAPKRGPGKRRPAERGSGTRRATERGSGKPEAGDRRDRPGRPTARRPDRGDGPRRAGKPPATRRPRGAPPVKRRAGQGSAPPAKRRAGRGSAPPAQRRSGQEPSGGEAAAVFREARRAAQRARGEARPERTPDAPREPEIWIDEGRVDDPATRRRRRPPRGRGRPSPPEPRPTGDGPRRPSPLSRLTTKEQHRLHDASIEFQDEHFSDARKLLGDLATHHPDIAEIRELHGLTLYRLERWREAARELEAFHRLSGSAEQNPVLADCYRALQRHEEVDDLWEELAAQSPAAPIVAEGRIVTAASLADRGDLDAAIRLLEGTPSRSGKPRPHDLRVWYALADLYDRAGDQPRARDLFARVVRHDSSFADAARRLTDLG